MTSNMASLFYLSGNKPGAHLAAASQLKYLNAQLNIGILMVTIINTMANNSQNTAVSRDSKEFKALVNYIDKNSPTKHFLFTISVFHKYAKEFLAPILQRGERIGRPDHDEIERRLNLSTKHPDNAWIHAPSETTSCWGQTEHATAYFMRMIKGELDAEKTWAGESDVWPRWSRSFWSAFTRLQDVFMEEWMWPADDPTARRVFADEETERSMRAALLGLFDEIERDGPFVLGVD
ncbi:hypothetical protein QBC42DRAFT_269968 [Cladorrhinum samala]|uniref:Uncharacterized protein n=1 Tax=Cladorrhinum samala TaxID=585594 RepID=A0AAV9HN93_9PEZI|nr:hypothetical protein QBC42DRAFT_269968 [Cladorrhinum samala]